MAGVFKSPLATFRGVSSPAAGNKATVTIAALASNSGQNFVPYMIVQNVTACVAAGTAAQTPVICNLIDGTTGGTSIQWTGVLSAPVNQAANIPQADLQIPIVSGNATLEFAAAPVAGAQQAVAISGYHVQYGDV